MKTLICSAIAVTVFCVDIAYAEERKPDNEVSFNLAATSDYRYRGISQSRLQPALQGGADYVNNPSGFYAGAWLSTIKWINDVPGAGSTPLELDFYLGRRGEIAKEVSYDVGLLTYVYSGNKLGTVNGFANADTTEVYGQVGFGPTYIKYSHAVTNLFANPDSKNSSYFDLGANLELGDDYILNLHAGYQKVRGPNSSAATYSDYKIGISKELKQMNSIILNLAAIGSNGDRVFYASPANGRNLGKFGVVLSISKIF